MESIFLLGDGDRAAFLQQMMQSFGCLHICLWSYLPHPSKCLLAMDGLYRELSNQLQPSSSSSGSLSRRLFDVYRESVNYVDTGRIPGFAFKNNLPYMELKLHDLQRMASHEVQLKFYQEAGIKTVVFMGCAAGEIELGMSNDLPQVDLEKKMKNLFPVDFCGQAAMSGDLPNQPPASSSSSSLRSLSVDSPPEYSPLLFNINPTTNTTTCLFVNQELLQETNIPIGEYSILEESSLSSIPLSTPIITTCPQLQAPEALISQIQNINNNQFPTTKAILAVLTSSTSTNISQQNLLLPPNIISPRYNYPTAFTRYNRAARPIADVPRKHNHNMFKRAVLFFRNLNMKRRHHELQVLQGNRPTTTQLHHMISERRRREKLNESFQLLRSLLSSGTKKDKASVLSSTTEYLSSLKYQLAELSKRNQMLESQLSVQRSSKAIHEDDLTVGFTSVDQRINVEITKVSSSSNSEARFLDLRVRVRSSGESNSMLDSAIRMLEFLKHQRNVSLSSVESNTRIMLESVPVHEMMMRLKIEGDEFDESSFGEAVRRVVDDQPH